MPSLTRVLITRYRLANKTAGTPCTLGMTESWPDPEKKTHEIQMVTHSWVCSVFSVHTCEDFTIICSPQHNIMPYKKRYLGFAITQAFVGILTLLLLHRQH